MAATVRSPGVEDMTLGAGGGGGYSSAGHIYPPGATLSDLAWDEKVKNLKDFVATYRLPMVARVRSGDLSKFLPPCGPHQDNAVQIHEVRRRKIVLARRLQWEKRQNDYIVSGEQVEVPASFKGEGAAACLLKDFTHMGVYLAYLPVALCLCPSVCLSLSLFLSLSPPLSLCLSLTHTHTHTNSLCLSASISLPPSVFVSLFGCLSLCLCAGLGL